MSLVTLAFLVIGLVILIVGAELLVRGASKSAMSLGISPLVVGLTVVAFGTSSPEMAVSTISSWNGNADIALGNVVGSNIFNVLFILGISALIIPLTVHPQVIRFDVPVMIGVSLLCWFFALDGAISRLEGAILFFGVISYTAYLIRMSRQETHQQEEIEHTTHTIRDSSLRGWAFNIGMIVAGLAMLVLGSNWLVDGAVMIAEAFGVSQLVIGLTIVALGTSLPEVATSIVAALRGERDIAVGNVVGSNIFNILSVLGLSSMVSSHGITVSPVALNFDIPVMVAIALIALPIFYSSRQISRWEGLLFLGYYVAYTIYLIISNEYSPTMAFYQQALTVVLPITVVIVLLTAWMSRRGQASVA